MSSTQILPTTPTLSTIPTLPTRTLDKTKRTRVQNHKGEYLQETLEELLEEVSASIKSIYPESKVILFGSFARGEQTKDSDLDLCVLVPELTDRRLEMEVGALCAIKPEVPLPKEAIVVTFSEFEQERHNINLLSYSVFHEGVVLDD